MVTIRLSRYGRKKAPFYRVVAVDSGKKTVGSVLEFLGTWNPKKKIKEIDNKKVDAWVKKGAQLSLAVKKLLEKE